MRPYLEKSVKVSVASDSVNPWTVARQAPLSMRFSRQEYWSGLPFPSLGNLANPGLEPTSLKSPALAGRLFTTSTAWVFANVMKWRMISERNHLRFKVGSKFFELCPCKYKEREIPHTDTGAGGWGVAKTKAEVGGMGPPAKERAGSCPLGTSRGNQPSPHLDAELLASRWQESQWIVF